MRDDMPSVYLLAGPASPAKAAYAKVLAKLGVAEVPTSEGSVADLLLAHLRSGRDAFVSAELSDVEERERCRTLVEENGGQWCLINFSIDHAALGLPATS